MTLNDVMLPRRDQMNYPLLAPLAITAKVEKHYKLRNWSKCAVYLAAKVFNDESKPSDTATQRVLDACKREGFVCRCGKRDDGEFDCVVTFPGGKSWNAGSYVFNDFISQ